MSRLGKLGHGLYSGQVSYDFVGKWRRWIALSGVVILIGIIGLAVRGLNLGIEFKGGTQLGFSDTGGYSTSQVTTVVTNAGAPEPVVQKLTPVGGGAPKFEIETKPLTSDEVDAIANAISEHFNVNANQVSNNTVGSSWGQQITNKAVQSLIFFIIAIIIYLSLRYEWKMAAGAIIATIHDLIVTVCIYATVGFSVSPSTVIGLLTILGYSLYDTVVVFDKVRENTKDIAGGSRMTYSQAANLGVNQTLVRSINTSVIALLPVASLLFVGAGLLGAGSLKDLALALFIGLATGTYSSIFIATPLVVVFKEREPQYQALAKRVAARTRGAGATRTPVAVAAGGSTGAQADAGVATAVAERPLKPSPRPPADAEPASDKSAVDDTDAADATPARPSSTPATRRPNSTQRRPSGRPAGKKRHR